MSEHVNSVHAFQKCEAFGRRSQSAEGVHVLGQRGVPEDLSRRGEPERVSRDVSERPLKSQALEVGWNPGTEVGKRSAAQWEAESRGVRGLGTALASLELSLHVGL